ncbi:hypothetical protein M426DRAFT_65635 [Hypoxylon sp. CI-4A]|nr:hypothetical protein M426DRAFT_65635 [Hypoxylon sp. CI-4A]
MDKKLDACFDRVEKALGTLVDSISKYNPSVNQVNGLGLADIELNKGLEDLQTHQSNYRRIQDLRAATSSFDAQIKDTLRLLANTRKELVNAPSTVFPNDVPSYDINYEELLAYARRISKTTLPPVGAVNAIQNEAKPESNGGADTAAGTPASATPNGAQSAAAAAANGIIQQQTPAVTTTDNEAKTTLPEEMRWNMNPYSGFQFIPWPNEDQVRKGALAELAQQLAEGKDPANYDPEREKAEREREEEERRQAEEREKQEREEKERRAREEQERRREREREQEALRRASMGGPGGHPLNTSPVVEKVQFQFMADDDDDDDD